MQEYKSAKEIPLPISVSLGIILSTKLIAKRFLMCWRSEAFSCDGVLDSDKKTAITHYMLENIMLLRALLKIGDTLLYK